MITFTHGSDEFLIVVDNSFLLKWTGKDFSHNANFEVYEITALGMDEQPYEWELYLNGTVKWDGCSHIYFGPNDNGYLHLCGAHSWQIHNELMTTIWELCSKKIENWNPM